MSTVNTPPTNARRQFRPPVSGYLPGVDDDLTFHLMLVAHTGTAKHLAALHLIPEDLIDRDDLHGLIADHAWLHGFRATPDGRRLLPRRAEDG